MRHVFNGVSSSYLEEARLKATQALKAKVRRTVVTSYHIPHSVFTYCSLDSAPKNRKAHNSNIIIRGTIPNKDDHSLVKEILKYIGINITDSAKFTYKRLSELRVTEHSYFKLS
ncbi:hypothetical protein GJ496_002061 [Pomphorhynchus laevis]|nr:hypothetical protein GJ496_002061 [Pomphorhynchus laevis]